MRLGETLLIEDTHIDFSKKCINENGDFVPSEEMNRIVKFYDDSDDSFAFFIIDIPSGTKILLSFKSISFISMFL